MKRSLKLLVLLALSKQALAMGPQWTWEAGKQTNNGAITVKSTNGSTTYAGTQNPTGAVAKVNQNAVTQPPTVIVQATASLPIKVAGDPCTASTSGSSPQMADEGTAILADRSLLLTCQSGAWKNVGGGCSGAFCLLAGKGPIICNDSYGYAKAAVASDGTLQLYGSDAKYLAGSGLQSINYYSPTTASSVFSSAHMDQVAYGGGANDNIWNGTFTVTTAGIFRPSGAFCLAWL